MLVVSVIPVRSIEVCAILYLFQVPIIWLVLKFLATTVKDFFTPPLFISIFNVTLEDVVYTVLPSLTVIVYSVVSPPPEPPPPLAPFT